MFEAALERPTTLSSPFDRRARFVYGLIAAEGMLGAALLAALGFQVSNPMLFAPPLWGAMLIGSGLAARRIGRDRIAGACETIALFYCQGMAALTLVIPLAAISAPLADAKLAAVDGLLGFRWLDVASHFTDNAAALRLLALIYKSIQWQPLVVLLVLFSTGRDHRAWQFLTASSVALAMTLALFPFAPAQGAALHAGLTPERFPGVTIPWEFGPAITSLQSGLRSIGPDLFKGLVSFPSFHAAAALLFTWGAWSTRLRLPMLALNAAMTFAAVVVGAHYLVDILAGDAVAAASIWLSVRLCENSASGIGPTKRAAPVARSGPTAGCTRPYR